MNIQHIHGVPPLYTNTFLIITNAKHGVLIDAAAEVQEYDKILREKGAVLTHILCTHGHYDHVGSAGVLSREWGAKVWCEPADCGGTQFFPLKGADFGYEEGGNTNGSTSRVWLLEVFAHDFVDLGEMAQVSQEDVQLDDVLERTACRFSYRLQVFEYLNGLGFKAFNQFHGFWVQGDLTGHVDSIASFDRLRISTDSSRCLIAGDNSLGHG